MALALECARHGHAVALFSRNAGQTENVASRARSFGVQAVSAACDVSDSAQVRSAVAQTIEAFGRIDVAVCNAGVGVPEWMTEFSAGRFKQVSSINTFGIAHMLEHCLPHMLERGTGIIAGVSSLTDVRGYPGSAAYCASKAAASALLESARVELRQRGIRVVTVRPGFVRTDMTANNEFPMPFLMSPEAAARIMYRGIMRGRRRVSFPLAMNVASALIRLLPNALYDKTSIAVRPPSH